MQLKWLRIRFRGRRGAVWVAAKSWPGAAADNSALLCGAGQQQLFPAQKVGREVPLHSCGERIAVRPVVWGRLRRVVNFHACSAGPSGPGRLFPFGPRGGDCVQCLPTVSLLGRGVGHALRWGCWCSNGCIRPVLKHGPRSATCVRVLGWKTRRRNEGEGRRWSAEARAPSGGASSTDPRLRCGGI